MKSFCQEHLPRFSKRVDLNTFDVSAISSQGIPRVMLLSTKKDTPVIWRVLSGLYNGRFVFYNTEVCYIFGFESPGPRTYDQWFLGSCHDLVGS